MKHLPYIAITAFLLAAVLFMCSCSSGRKYVFTPGNKHKYHHFYKQKKEERFGVLDTAIVTFLPDTTKTY